MSRETASIRELRTDFRSIKRKLEQHGEIVITDNGEPAYILKPLPRKSRKSRPLPDYYGQLLRRQPQAMSAEETRKFWEDERGR